MRAGENDNGICDTKPLMLRPSIISKEERFSADTLRPDEGINEYMVHQGEDEAKGRDFFS